jgi:hypothetical protein
MTIRFRVMTETDLDLDHAPGPPPDESPFAIPAVEGMPFERGSEEDEAIERVLQRSRVDAAD